MAKNPTLKHTVRVGKRTFKVRSNKSFFTEVPSEAIKATGPQIKALAYGSYTLLVDKILSGDAQGFPTRITVSQMPYYDTATTNQRGRTPLDMPPLSELYLNRKVAEGLDPRPLIATGFYLENIQVAEEQTKQGKLYSVYVPDIIHKPSGVGLQTIVGWLEYGTTNSPSRAHWRPVALIVRRRWARLPNNIRVDALRQSLKKLR